MSIYWPIVRMPPQELAATIGLFVEYWAESQLVSSDTRSSKMVLVIPSICDRSSCLDQSSSVHT